MREVHDHLIDYTIVSVKPLPVADASASKE
jgi:hypothetical protein